MRRNVITILLCLLTAVGLAQKEKFPEPDVKAEFPGGNDSLMQFIYKSLIYPSDCAKEKISGRTITAFVVGVDGGISNPEVLRSPDERLSKEVLRILSIMPKWKPALLDNKPVAMKYTIPITFRLPEKKASGVTAAPADVWQQVDKVTAGCKENPRGLYRLVKFAYDDGSKRDAPFDQYKYSGDSIALQWNVQKDTDKEYWAELHDNDGMEFNYSAPVDDKKTHIYDSNDKGFKLRWYSEYIEHELFPYRKYVTELYSSENIPVSAKRVVDMLEMKTATGNKLYGCWHRYGAMSKVEGMDMLLIAPHELYQVFDKEWSLQVYDLNPGMRFRAYCVLRPIVYKENNVIVQHGAECKIEWVNDNLFKLSFDRGDGTIVTELWKRSGLPRNFQRVFGTNLPTFQIENPIPNYFRQ
jgi:hypothetical protein